MARERRGRGHLSRRANLIASRHTSREPIVVVVAVFFFLAGKRLGVYKMTSVRLQPGRRKRRRTTGPMTGKLMECEHDSRRGRKKRINCRPHVGCRANNKSPFGCYRRRRGRQLISEINSVCFCFSAQVFPSLPVADVSIETSSLSLSLPLGPPLNGQVDCQ